MTAHVEVYRTPFARRSQKWRWRLVHENGHKIATSGEGYANRGECERMAIAVVGGKFKAAVTPKKK